MSKEKLISEIDNLSVRESGVWIKRKHHFLREYIKMFTIGMGKKWPRLTYMDLFAGPGRCLIGKSGEDLEGSPLIALTYDFNQYVFIEEDQMLFQALKERCSRSSKKINFINKDCNQNVAEVIKAVPRDGLTLAFIDPTDININFDLIKEFSQLPNGVDLLMNIQFGIDVKRNFKSYIEQGDASRLKKFLGHTIDIKTLQKPADVISAYKHSISTLGYKTVEFREITVKNSKNAPMYFLLFASKHSTGLKFWTEISKKDEQGQEELF